MPFVLWLGNLHRRVLAVCFGIIGPRLTYRIMGFGGRMVYRLLDPLRVRSEAQCRAALGPGLADDVVARIAEQAFVQRTWNLADLLLASRRLSPTNFARYGGCIPEPHRSAMLDAQRRGQPAILLTAYYGSFDLLPVFLGYNGLRATVVYLPHANAGFDAFRRRVRSRSGCELVPVTEAATRLGEVLAAGGTVGLVADHHVEERGIPVEFLGIETNVPRSVGLLAWRYHADVVVAGLRRLAQPFHFAFDVRDVIKPAEWREEEDAVDYITRRYLRALEAMIREDPTQYLWAYARWGEDFATAAVSPEKALAPPPPDESSTVPGGTGNGQSQAE